MHGLTSSLRHPPHIPLELYPVHNLRPVTPTANVLAMYETIHKLG